MNDLAMVHAGSAARRRLRARHHQDRHGADGLGKLQTHPASQKFVSGCACLAPEQCAAWRDAARRAMSPRDYGWRVCGGACGLCSAETLGRRRAGIISPSSPGFTVSALRRDQRSDGKRGIGSPAEVRAPSERCAGSERQQPCRASSATMSLEHGMSLSACALHARTH